MPIPVGLLSSDLVPVAALVVALGIVGVALVRWRDRIAGMGADFVIHHRPGAGATTAVRGRIPGARVGALRAFFERDLRPQGPVTVRGTWGPPPARTLRLQISGPLDAGQRQRLRNVLLDLLD